MPPLRISGSSCRRSCRPRIGLPPQLSDGQLAYAALDAIVALRLWLRLRAELVSKERGGAYLLQRDVTPAVTRMVSRGILLDRAAHQALLVQWSSQLADAREAFLAATGQPVPGTPDAIRAYLERVLPEPLRAQWPRTVKKGELTLREAELRRVAHLPAVQALLRVQATEKLLNSFGDELANKVSAKTGRIHPSFSIAGTKTGRFASSRPNVQQLPKRRAADFRDCIRAADGHSLVVGDFHMMELRAAAAISGDPQMTADFANGIDLHRQQAAAMLGIPYEQVDAEARDKAKPVNFSMIYGAGAAGLVASRLEQLRHHPVAQRGGARPQQLPHPIRDLCRVDVAQPRTVHLHRRHPNRPAWPGDRSLVGKAEAAGQR